MPSNLSLPDDLLNEALRLSGKRTKRAVVTEALEEYIQRRKQKEIIQAFGSFGFDPDYDYKAERRLP
ncbi:MAG: type II toxin-antitoxin system VapB family antitoxin [Candidatus Sericytochromatia bacterium]